MKTFFNLTIGFFVGSLVGAVVALLNAPQSGEETRAQIRDEVAETRLRVEQSISDAQASVYERLDEVQDRVQELFERNGSKAEKINQVA
jgi:gas vesicle protein